VNTRNPPIFFGGSPDPLMAALPPGPPSDGLRL